MLYTFGFERVAVVAGDLYFLDPNPGRGQEGAEHGVRIELRLINRGDPRGSIYAAIPIEVARPLWRVDLLESVDGKREFDRTHHHPALTNWEPNSRVFDKALTADPIGWLGEQLADLPALLVAGGVEPAGTDEAEAEQLRQAIPEIQAVTQRLLDRVRAGELGRPPAAAAAAGIRNGWL